MSSRRPARALLTILMDLLVAVAIAETLRLILRFFGQLAQKDWAGTVIAFTNPVTLPLGMHAIKTPYGGVFDVNAALMIVLLLVVEWVLSVIRSRA